ncbi:hypothetical protein [Vannielia sp.]|nr:hypothetical protein [Vannielia sp.]MDF1872540.1 hypothetical protein [Vannielia sp.]
MKTRWIKTTAEAANELNVQMPWERGARRASMIARRSQAMSQLNLLSA